jgi:hypothetical protein
MRNITVAVSDQAYRRARVWAAQRDSSISAIVQYCIERLPGLPIANQGFPLPKPATSSPEEPLSNPILTEKLHDEVEIPEQRCQCK